MTEIDEFRYDCIRRGITITEKIQYSPEMKIGYNADFREVVLVKMEKMDSPVRIVFDMTMAIDGSLYGTGQYLDALRQMGSAIDELIQRRHVQNPNTCAHNIIVVDGKRMCSNCIAILGQQIVLNINHN